MSFFSKKKQKEDEEIETLPRLPNLNQPNLIDEKNFDYNEFPQLPQYPSNSLGNKMSQDTIKEAVTGRKEDESLGDEDYQNHPSVPEVNLNNFKNEIQKDYRKMKTRTSLKKPVFIRIDKFEDSLRVFDELQNKISEMEDMLGEIKELRKREEKELSFWEIEIQEIKNQAEKVEKDLSSKIEDS